MSFRGECWLVFLFILTNTTKVEKQMYKLRLHLFINSTNDFSAELESNFKIPEKCIGNGTGKDRTDLQIHSALLTLSALLS